MELLALLAAALPGVATAQTEVLPPGEWRPAEVGVVQRRPDRDADWMAPEIEVTLQWEPGDPAVHLSLDLEATLELIQRLVWVQECASETLLFANGRLLRWHGAVLGGGIWPLHAYFERPKGPVDSLQLILRQRRYTIEPVSATLRYPPGPGSALRVGPLVFRPGQIAPSAYPPDARQDMPEVQPTRLLNARYVRTGVVPADVTKLVLVGERVAVEEVPRLRLTTVELVADELKAQGLAAWIGCSEKPGVPPHLYVWFPVAQANLPTTWELSVGGEFLRLEPDGAEEQIVDLPIPASGL